MSGEMIRRHTYGKAAGPALRVIGRAALSASGPAACRGDCVRGTGPVTSTIDRNKQTTIDHPRRSSLVIGSSPSSRRGQCRGAINVTCFPVYPLKDLSF